MKKEPFVSVLVAAYKTNKNHLQACIESILAQTYKNFELLILDDCPDDTSVYNVIKSYSDPRIFYRQNKKKLGIANTRNELMAWAKGTYFAVMDHDDIMMPTRLEKQVEYMESHPEVGICGTAFKRFGDLKKRGVISHVCDSDSIKASLFFNCPIHHPSTMLRSEIIHKYAIKYNPAYISANDRHLYLDLMPYTKMHNLSEVLMLYRMHANMTSKQKRVVILKEQEKLRNEMLHSLQIDLSDSDLKTLNNYVLKGRCRIKNAETLYDIERLLILLDSQNKKVHYFPVDSFSQLCAKYLIKRCLNAAFFGFVNSKDILKRTPLPIKKIPLKLGVLNFILPRTKQKYDFVFSMGAACSCASTLKRLGLRTTSSPFDWLFGPSFSKRAQFLLNHFSHFIDKKDLEYQHCTNGELYHPKDVYKNIQNHIIFNHDFEAGKKLDETYLDVREKYDRRIKILLETLHTSKRVLAVYIQAPHMHENETKEEIINSWNKIRNYFKSENLYLLYVSLSSNLPHGKILQTQYTQGITFISANYKTIKKNALPHSVHTRTLNVLMSPYIVNRPFMTRVKRRLILIFIGVIPISRWRRYSRNKFLTRGN